MFKRIILILIVSLSFSGLNEAKAASTPDYRSYAKAYLESAVTFAFDTYNSAKASGSSTPWLAYIYALQAKYSTEISAWLAKYGNTTLADLYNQVSYLMSSSALTHARDAYVNSTAANSASAYYSYIYTYLGNLYSYYASIYK